LGDGGLAGESLRGRRARRATQAGVHRSTNRNGRRAADRARTAGSPRHPPTHRVAVVARSRHVRTRLLTRLPEVAAKSPTQRADNDAHRRTRPACFHAQATGLYSGKLSSLEDRKTGSSRPSKFTTTAIWARSALGHGIEFTTIILEALL
jgi:hypothetical protein